MYCRTCSPSPVCPFVHNPLAAVKSAGRESVIHCKLTIRNKTYNFVHNVSKLCDKCYKLLNESVLSGLGIRIDFA